MGNTPTPTKYCPKCHNPLKEGSQKSFYCLNGCDIYTAKPQGQSYLVTQRGNRDDWNLVVGGGQRTDPRIRDDEE